MLPDYAAGQRTMCTPGHCSLLEVPCRSVVRAGQACPGPKCLPLLHVNAQQCNTRASCQSAKVQDSVLAASCAQVAPCTPQVTCLDPTNPPTTHLQSLVPCRSRRSATHQLLGRPCTLWATLCAPALPPGWPLPRQTAGASLRACWVRTARCLSGGRLWLWQGTWQASRRHAALR